LFHLSQIDNAYIGFSSRGSVVSLTPNDNPMCLSPEGEGDLNRKKEV
jgi:hypothetical protein